MLRTAAASRFPTAEWSAGRSAIAPPSWNTITAECGDRMRSACSRCFASSSGVDPGQVLRLPVVAAALGLRRVEQALQRDVRTPLQQVAHGLAERLERRQQLLAVLRASRCSTRAASRSAGRARPWPATAPAGPCASRRRGSARAAPRTPACGTARAPRPRTRPATRRVRRDLRADRVELVLDARDHAEVAAAAAQAPEEVRVLFLARAHLAAVRGHQLHRPNAVARPAEAARQVAEAAAEREPGDTRWPRRSRAPPRAREAASRDPRPPAGSPPAPGRPARQDPPRRPASATGRQQPAFGQRQPGDVVTAAAHRERERVLAREAHAGEDVGQCRCSGRSARAAGRSSRSRSRASRRSRDRRRRARARAGPRGGPERGSDREMSWSAESSTARGADVGGCPATPSAAPASGRRPRPAARESRMRGPRPRTGRARPPRTRAGPSRRCRGAGSPAGAWSPARPARPSTSPGNTRRTPSRRTSDRMSAAPRPERGAHARARACAARPGTTAARRAQGPTGRAPAAPKSPTSSAAKRSCDVAVLRQALDRREVVGSEPGVDADESLAHRLFQALRRHARVDHERHVVREKAGVLRIGEVPHARHVAVLRIRDALHVRGDSHDDVGRPRIALAPAPDRPADRVQAGPVAPRERLAHHRDPLLSLAVAELDASPADDPDAEVLEVPGTTMRWFTRK